MIRVLHLFSLRRTAQPPSATAPSRRLVAQDRAEFRRLLTRVADRLPWFGEAPFDPDPDPQPPRDVLSVLPYQRRILLAMLLGRPVSKMAQKAGCGSRVIYKVLRNGIYTPAPLDHIPCWQELGLLALVDTPLVDFDPGDRPVYRGFPHGVLEADQAAIFCLICHRFIGGVDLDYVDRQHDGRVLEATELVRSDQQIACHAQAHLIAHFLIASDPIRSKPESFLQQLDRVFLGIGRAPRTATSWQMVVPRETLDLARRYRSHPKALVPRINGEPITPADARRRWKLLLGNPGAPKKKGRGSGRSRSKTAAKSRT